MIVDMLVQFIGLMMCLVLLGIMIMGFVWVMWCALNERDDYYQRKQQKIEEERKRADRRG